jgi:lipid II:glycine glycyltransferase (peptidoglycan interpeptide bridge formation enzyme)
MAEALVEITHQERLDLLIVDPADVDSAAALESVGFAPAKFDFTLPSTVIVDVDADDETLLGRMKAKTRYNIRNGLRSGVTVRHGTGTPDVEVFHRLLAETGNRQGFASDGPGYITAVLETLSRDDGAVLLLAERDGVALAGSLIAAFGDRAVYKRGGWSGVGSSFHPNEALHWAGMRWARATGRRWYDFDGIDLASIRDGASSRSVAHFKMGFGGEIVTLPPTLVYLRNPIARTAHERLSASGIRRAKRIARRFQVSS